MTTPTDEQLARVGHVVRDLRPEWDLNGVRAALRRCNGWSLGPVAVTAIAAALDSTAKTPAVIEERLRRGWQPHTVVDAPTPTPPPVSELWRTLPPERERVPGPNDEQRAMIRRALSRFDGGGDAA